MKRNAREEFIAEVTAAVMIFALFVTLMSGALWFNNELMEECLENNTQQVCNKLME